jgi:hypothetical protein
MRDPYAVLGVPRSAPAEDIKTCYRRLAKAMHPDGNKNDPKAPAHFAELNAAYEILGDEDKRKAFDRGEIDARGQPIRRWSLPARQPPQPFAAGLIIILLMLAATIIRTFTAPDEIHVSNSLKDAVLPRAGANGGHAGAAQPDREAESAPQLMVQPSASFAAANAVPLGIQVSGQTSGLALEISGLSPGMTISSGRALGTGRWRILATDVDNATIQPPPGFGDTIDLAVELRLADDTLVDSRSLRLRWMRVRTVVPDQIESVGGIAVSDIAANKATTTPALTNQNADRHAGEPQLPHEQVELLVARSHELISQGDVGAARTLLRRAAEARDASAALALGGTYDPIMLEILKAQGVAGDTSVARDWYKRAAEFGSREAQDRLNLLGR